MPVDYSKFDNIEDSDDEGEKRQAAKKDSDGGEDWTLEDEAVAEEGPSPGAIAEALKEHARPLDDAPELQNVSGDFLDYYQNKMTPPQRMQTLIMLWNASPQEERVLFLRHLIDIINNPAISNRIKGGQGILKDLNTNYYRGVTYPVAWPTQFKEKMNSDDKKLVFEMLFKSLDPSEQGLVLGTLS